MSWLSLMAQLGININPYVQGLYKARGEATKFGTDVGSRLKNSLAGAFGTAAIAGFARKTIEFGSQISDLSERLGIGTTALQEWNYAATQNGASAEDVTSFFEKIADAQTNALRGNAESLASFKRLGVSLSDLKKLGTEEIGKKIAAAVRGGDVQKLTADLRDIGGRSSTKLVTAFKNGIEEASAEAHGLGQIIDEQMIGKMDQLGDRADQVAKNLMGPMATLLGWLNAAFTKISQTFQLLGAYSAHWKGFFKGGFDTDIISFLNSKEAQDIVNQPTDPAEKKAAAREAGEFDPKKKKAKFDRELLGSEAGRLQSDSLASVGGFVGRASQRSPVVDIAREQLKIQQKIAQNTDPEKNLNKF